MLQGREEQYWVPRREMFSGVVHLFFTSPKPVGVEAAEQHRKHKCILCLTGSLKTEKTSQIIESNL